MADTPRANLPSLSRKRPFDPGPWHGMKLPVLFRNDDVVPAEFTAIGSGIRRRRPRRLDIYRQLIDGPHLAAFDAGIYEHEAPR